MVIAAMLPLATRVMGAYKVVVNSEKLQADMKTEGYALDQSNLAICTWQSRKR